MAAAPKPSEPNDLTPADPGEAFRRRLVDGFVDLIAAVHGGETMTLTQHGKPVLVVVDYDEYEQLRAKAGGA